VAFRGEVLLFDYYIIGVLRHLVLRRQPSSFWSLRCPQDTESSRRVVPGQPAWQCAGVTHDAASPAPFLAGLRATRRH